MTRRMLLIATIAFLSACSGDSSTTPATVISTTAPTTIAAPTTVAPTTTAAPTTIAAPATVPSTTAAPTTTAAALPIETIAQQLLTRYDDASAAILVDPRVASDPANPLVAAYLALFPADSTFAKGTVEFWASEGAQGRFYRAGGTGKLFATTLNKVIATSDTEATVSVCTVQSITVVSETGTVLESTGGVAGGQVVLVKSGDTWLLRDLTRTSADDCPKPGSGG